MTTTITRSPRTIYPTPDRVNRVPNPARRTAVAWSVYAGASGTSTPSAGAGVGPVAGVTTYQRQTWTVASTNYGDIVYGAGKEFQVSNLAGRQFTVSMYIRNTVAMAGCQLVVEFYTAADVLIGAALLGATTAVAANQWGRVSVVNQVVPANAAYIIIRARSRVVQPVGSVMDGTALILEAPGTILDVYFDGTTANIPPALIYAWQGVADASISTQSHYDPADIFNAVEVMDGYDMSRASNNTVITVPGRVKPVVYTRPAQGRAGQIQLVIGDTEADVVAFDTLMAAAAAFTITDTDRAIVGMAFALDTGGYRVALDDETRAVFVATLQVVEQ